MEQYLTYQNYINIYGIIRNNKTVHKFTLAIILQALIAVVLRGN